MAEIQYIAVAKLWPHPDNPRKDVGDVTELAESIKANGVLQNLTVVPRLGGITGKPTGSYTVIIGHRRLAAAKAAGLKTVPCVITEMTLQEQVGTMLLENMQRSDLTVYEQAQGFQMMLNMGETVETVAEKTGFSQSTVRRRVKLLDLDPEKFRKSEARGATLQDYVALEKISDLTLRNQVLESIGTANFQQQLKLALEKEKIRVYIDQTIAGLETFAQRIDEADRETMDYQGNYGWWNKKEVQRPEDADTVQYYFKVGRNADQVDLYRQKIRSEESTAAEEGRKRRADERERRLRELKAFTKQAYELRVDFVREFSGAKRYFPEIAAFAGRVLLDFDIKRNAGIDYELLCELLSLNCDLENEDFDTAAYCQKVREHPEYSMFCTAYAGWDNDSSGYYGYSWSSEKQTYEIGYQANDDLDRLYDFLRSLGYEMSDLEKELQNGTHELFREIAEEESEAAEA